MGEVGGLRPLALGDPRVSEAIWARWFQADTIDSVSDSSGGVALGSTEVLKGPQIAISKGSA